jgi:3-deoxy-D-manno-octulosonic-acid transferase
MGISSHRIKIAGNLKFDNDVKKLSKDEELALGHSLGFGESDPILLGSSTWPGEEEVLLRALRKCQNIDKRWKLLLVPRHAERRDRIVAILQASKFKWHRKSNGDSAEGVDVCLADTTGELQTLTSLCTLAFIGKSLGPNGGGQSPLDAACCGIPMVYGNRMTNFRDICSSLEQGKCVVKVRDAATAVSAIATLARDGDRRKVFAKSLMEWHRNNCGASKFVFQKICEIAFAKK